jgi:hypothetical protein
MPPDPRSRPLPRRRPGSTDPGLFAKAASPERRPRLARTFYSCRPAPPGRREPFGWFGRPGALLAVLAALLAGCTDGPSAGTGGARADRAAASTDAARNLRSVCPARVTVQTSWLPEATHGGLYQLLGEGYTVDRGHKLVRGPLVSRGVDTGVELEIRAGGPAVGNQPVSALMTADPSITLAQQATEEQVLGWASGQPTVAVMAPFDADPLVFIWDRRRHPEWNTIQDIGQTDAKVVTFRSANIDYLLGAGILRPGQVDYSYDGSPSRLMADRSVAVGGFSTNEPFIYRGMGVDVGYAYVYDTGYPDYRNTLVVRRADRERLDGCLRLLVPVLQAGMVDFLARPDPVLQVVVRLTGQYASPFPYPFEQARYGVQVMTCDGLVAVQPGQPYGAMKPDRVQRMVDVLRPIYAARRQVVPADATAASLATNDYLDESLRLPRTVTDPKECPSR